MATTRAGGRALALACRPLLRALASGHVPGTSEGLYIAGAGSGLVARVPAGPGRAFFRTATPALASLSITIPALGESISDGTVAALLKQAGESVQEDEPIISIETDKVTVDVRAPQAGVLMKYTVEEGETVEVGNIVALIDTEQTATSAPKEVPPAAEKVVAVVGAEQASSSGGSASHEGSVRSPSIHFPPRRTADGAVISMLPAAEALAALQALGEGASSSAGSGAAAAAADVHPPTVLAAAAPPPKQGPWLQLNVAVTTSVDDGESVPRTTMTDREMELIMLGGAEP